MKTTTTARSDDMCNRDHDHEQQQEHEQEPAQASSKACGGAEQGQGLNSYEQRQEAKRERFEARAGAARNESQQLWHRARSMASAIPFGQPILVGHHSEGRDRRYRARIDSTFGKAFAADDKAKHYEQKAAAVGTGGISSDDPDAIDKLRAQLADVEKAQRDMKAANAAIRKGKTPEAKVANLVQLGYSEAEAQRLVAPDFCGRVGFPSYALTNNNANARRIQKRIEQLEQARTAEPVTAQGNGYEYREDTDENRVMFVFPGKPDEATRAVLKRNAFKWSPSRGAWVRQLNNAGRWAAGNVRAYLDSLTG